MLVAVYMQIKFFEWCIGDGVIPESNEYGTLASVNKQTKQHIKILIIFGVDTIHAQTFLKFLLH